MKDLTPIFLIIFSKFKIYFLNALIVELHVMRVINKFYAFKILGIKFEDSKSGNYIIIFEQIEKGFR